MGSKKTALFLVLVAGFGGNGLGSRATAGLTVSSLPAPAENPNPSDEGENVCEDVVLSWSTGAYVDDHNIYFGTSLSDVNENAMAQVIHWGANSWDPPGELALNTTYYWRVDTVNDACSPYVWQGGIWEFTTHDGSAFTVFPHDEAVDVPIDSSLSWGACGADSYEVYLSLDFNDVNEREPAAYLGTELESTYDPGEGGEFIHNQTHYWAIDTLRGLVRSRGGVWSFTTRSSIVDPNLLLWYKLDETNGDIAHDDSGHEWDAHVDGSVGGPNWEPL